MTTTPQASTSNSTRPRGLRTASLVLATIAVIVTLILSVGSPTASAQLPEVDQAELHHVDVTRVPDIDAESTVGQHNVGDGELSAAVIDSLAAPDLCRSLLVDYRNAMAAGDRLAAELARFNYRNLGCEHFIGFVPL